jgi:hypothetical protein
MESLKLEFKCSKLVLMVRSYCSAEFRRLAFIVEYLNLKLKFNQD